MNFINLNAILERFGRFNKKFIIIVMLVRVLLNILFRNNVSNYYTPRKGDK